MMHNKKGFNVAIPIVFFLLGAYGLYAVYCAPIHSQNLTNGTPTLLPPPPAPAPIPQSLTATFVDVSPPSLSYKPLKSIQNTPPFQNGKLAYAGYFSVKDAQGKWNWSPYLFVQFLKDGNTVTKQIIKPANITSDYIFDPQFSPDGRYIAFEYGWPYDDHGMFQEYIWDLKENKYLKPIDKFLSGNKNFLSYRELFWSPNGKYIAYVRGGDQDGNDYSQLQPIRLYIHNINDGKDYFVAQNSYATHMAWTPQNTLLYCEIPKSELGDISPKQGKIYEVSPDGTSSKLLIEGGFDPRPSPDGKYIVYFGWPQDNTTATVKKADKNDTHNTQLAQIGLYVFERATGKKSLLWSPVSDLTFINMLWKPDSSGIIFLKFLSRSPHAKAQISEINITDKTNKVIAIVDANDDEDAPRSKTEPEVKPIRITPDGKYLIVRKTEFTGSDGSIATGVVSIDAINLINGSIVNGVELTSFMGLDYLPTQ